MNPPLPPNERERLLALKRHAIVDTPPEAGFDRVTRMAAHLLKVPISTLTLIDEDRQWFKSCYGLNVRESSRNVSFCAHAILSESMTLIPDAAHDHRFKDNPLVTGDPHIRFYAGVPLETEDGFRLGTLCAIDTQPRDLSAEEQEILRDLAAMVTDTLNLRLATRQRSQLAVAVAHLKSGVVMSDPDFSDCPLTFANPEFLRMTGYAADEIIGINCRFLQGPQTDRETVAKLHEAISLRHTFHSELLNYRKDGSSFWNDLTVSPVFDDAGELISFVGLQTDVTERKRTADELKISYEKLRVAEGLRDSLTGMLIHDLRSPLTSVVGFLDLLRTLAADKLSAQEKQCIEIALGGAAKLQEMITSLLDVSRLEAGEMPLNLRPSDLREIITSAADAFRSLLGKRSLVCDLPSQPVELRLDFELLKRVVTNLLSNAVKFTPEPGTIRVSIENEDERMKVSISDTGPGIPSEYHTRIFEKFGQVDGRKHRHSSGLGLTFCKLAIEAHGGAIGVESSEGSGTTMWFVI